jgi:hypothetical protein
MPPSQRVIASKATAGISTPPPINTAEQSTLSARERLRLHVQRNLHAQEQKAKQLAEQQAVAASSGIPILPPSLPGSKVAGRSQINQRHSAGLQTLYAPIQDTRLGLNDITEHEASEIVPAPCILPEPVAAVAAAVGFVPLIPSEVGTEIGLEPNSESPPDFGDTPPYEQDGSWPMSHHRTASGPIGQGGDEEWTSLIDLEPVPQD